MSNLMGCILIPILSVAVIALVIIGLINFHLLTTLVAKLIAVIIVIGVFFLIGKMIIFPK